MACLIDLIFKENHLSSLFDVPIDPPALRPQYSKRPSNTGQSSPTLTGIFGTRQHAAIPSNIHPVAYILLVLLGIDPYFRVSLVKENRYSHRCEIVSFPIC